MKNNYYLIITLCGTLLMASCSKFLDREPLSIPTDENFWKNQAEAVSGLAGGYALIRKTLSEVTAFHFYGDIPTDQFVPTLPGEDIGTITRMEWGFPIPFSQTHRPMMKLRRFDHFYQAVDQANRCIKFIGDMPVNVFTGSDPQASKNMLIGEAHFLRAFNYFYMARVWGDVPLVLESEPVLSNAAPLPRTPQAQVLEQVISDLQAAIPLLSWGYSSNNDRAVRANRGAAYALLAHTYAWKGDYAACASAADSVILRGGYSLVSRANYLNIFAGKSSEGIFEIAQNANNEASGSQHIAFRTLKNPYLVTNQGNSQLPLDRSTLNRLYPDTNDLRVKNGFAFFNTTDPICIKYSNIRYTGTNASGQPIGPLAQSNTIVFRLADIMLLRAEALAALGQYTPARTLLNTVRSVANATEYLGPDGELFDYIMDERGRELFLEGHRFYDLVRQGRQTGVLNFGGTRMGGSDFQQGKYYWPIDPILFGVNPTFTQTPFWSDKM